MPVIANAVKQSRRTDPLSKPNPHQHLWPRTGVLRAPEYRLNPIGQYLLCSSIFFLRAEFEWKHQWAHSTILTKITTLE